MVEEIDHLMGLAASPQNALIRYSGTDALNDRIQEWFETPEGTVADLPSWGNTLSALKHEPPSVNLEVIMEMRIVKKLALDCNVPIYGIKISFLSIDKCHVTIMCGGGLFDGVINKNAF